MTLRPGFRIRPPLKYFGGVVEFAPANFSGLRKLPIAAQAPSGLTTQESQAIEIPLAPRELSKQLVGVARLLRLLARLTYHGSLTFHRPTPGFRR